MTDPNLIDYGQERLAKALEGREQALGIIAGVAARHAVSVAALTRKHRGRQKAHVVMARSHAASLLRASLFTWVDIARYLGFPHHSVAMQAAQRWADHRAGVLETVTESHGRAALDLMAENGWTVKQTARRMGLSPVKLKVRIDMIRARERATT